MREKSEHMLTLLFTYLAIGVVAGLLAGLFGIGGGLVIVPMLVFFMPRAGIPPEFIMHLALGTSMASIIFTSVSSFWAHHKRGAVRWNIVIQITPGIIIGTLFGSYIASHTPTNALKGFFVIFLYYVAIQMLVDRKPKPSRDIPGQAAMIGVGSVIGIVSSLVGIGGGTLSVPFMLWCNVAAHQAIGTSAAIGFPIAVSGAVGYIYNGLHVAGLPQYSFGYIYLPALVGIVIASVLTAPLGVRMAHSLPVPKLKRIFAVLLLIVGTRMVWGLFS